MGNIGREVALQRLPFRSRMGDDRSVKIKSLEVAKIMKIKWLVICCIEANFCKKILDQIYQIYIPLHLSDINNSAIFRHEF